jgi:hypothetical protein
MGCTLFAKRGLVTYYVLFFIHLYTRRVSIAGITEHADSAWMEQMGRHVTSFGPKTQILAISSSASAFIITPALVSDDDLRRLRYWGAVDNVELQEVNAPLLSLLLQFFNFKQQCGNLFRLAEIGVVAAGKHVAQNTRADIRERVMQVLDLKTRHDTYR